MNLRCLLLAFAALPSLASALGLGETNDPVFVGEPLSVRIPLLGKDVGDLSAKCVSLLPVPGDFAEKRLTGGSVSLESGALAVRTSRALSQPVISFRIRIECGWNLAKDFQLLPNPPRMRPTAAPAAASDALVATAPAPAPAVVTPARLAPPASSATSLPVAGNDGQRVDRVTTLRLMSRKRYPDDSHARVLFIRRVAAANPDIFPSIEGAFDQMLPAGTRLQMPGNLPAKVTKPKPAPKARSQSGVQTPTAGGRDSGKGRLVIGAGELPSRTAAEISEDLDRLIKAMTEQVQVEIAMAERIKKMEGEIEQAKLALAQQKAENQSLAKDVRELRDDLKVSNYIQLVLAILLGGVAVAAVMLWRGQQRQRIPTDIDFEFSIPAAIGKPATGSAPVAAGATVAAAAATSSAPAAAAPAAKLDDFDTLFDDLLPPQK